MNNVGTAYVLWLGCLLQLHGLQRLYNGKIFTGLLWMFTFGMFGVGQLVDLLLIPNMVNEHNLKLRARQGLSPIGAAPMQPQAEVVLRHTQPTSDRLMVQLLKAAESRGGKLSIAQGVMATGASFAAVEAVLKQMVRAGYVEISDDRTKSVVFHEFRPTRDQLMVQLLKAAEAKGGKLSVTQGVMATGISFAEVEALLKDMVKTGYVEVGNDPESGVVVYEFREL
jgi:predicted transcriptional regulator